MTKMDQDTADVFAILDAAKKDLPPTEPVELSAEYLDLVHRAMALPCNRDRADKTWVWNLTENSRVHFASALMKQQWPPTRSAS